MKKRKLAINSFLAVTAVAWLGQPLSAAENRRDNGLDHRSHESRHSGPLISNSDQQLELRYQAGDRALLRNHLRTLPKAQDWSLQAGQQLEFHHLSDGRTLPEHLQNTLKAPESVVDLIIGNQIVRMVRHERRIIDLV
ncbi:MAG: hypothetical protein CVV10_03975 [Gammaproteobacteria bacterium HGW-Gammaproteobacteria-14]|nr:MAG: hypothetical protein CVV10_03975 [Gammaproteobacteria bacterium HGW-Gammaproteobacteria-14]